MTYISIHLIWRRHESPWNVASRFDHPVPVLPGAYGRDASADALERSGGGRRRRRHEELPLRRHGLGPDPLGLLDWLRTDAERPPARLLRAGLAAEPPVRGRSRRDRAARAHDRGRDRRDRSPLLEVLLYPAGFVLDPRGDPVFLGVGFSAPDAAGVDSAVEEGGHAPTLRRISGSRLRARHGHGRRRRV